MHRKRLLFINGHLNAGGCERSLTDLLRHLDYTRYNVDLLLLEEQGDYARELPAEVNVQLYSLNNAFGPFLKCMGSAVRRKDGFSLLFRLIYMLGGKTGKEKLSLTRPLFRKLKKRYDAVIAFRPGICTDLAAYVFDAEKKVSWWHHGEFAYTQEQADKLNKAYRRFDHVAAVSESSAQIVREYFPSAADKVTVIPNMIDTEELTGKAGREVPAAIRSFQGLKIVSVGRMSPEKNMGLCPQIGRLLKNKGVPYRWVLIGDGEELDPIRESIRKLELTDCFVLTGRLPNPYPYVRGADFYVHPSLVESQGISILEAMALRTPVVAVSSAGPCEFIVNGVNGFLVEPEAEKMAAAIIKLSADEELRNGIARQGELTARKYAPEYTVQSFEKMVFS